MELGLTAVKFGWGPFGKDPSADIAHVEAARQALPVAWLQVEDGPGSLLSNPAEIQVATRNAVADLVTHIVHPVAREKKRDLLSYLIQTRDLKQVLVLLEKMDPREATVLRMRFGLNEEETKTQKQIKE